MPPPIQHSAAVLDLSPRLFNSVAVVGSPALAAETIVCSVAIAGDLATIAGVYLFGFAAFTVGTSGVSVNAKIRRTDTSGQTVVATGVTNEGVTAATQLGTRTLFGFDAFAPAPNAVYVLTLTVGSGAAASTVSAVSLIAIVA